MSRPDVATTDSTVADSTSVPRLGAGFSEPLPASTSQEGPVGPLETPTKASRRKLLELGKKRDGHDASKHIAEAQPGISPSYPSTHPYQMPSSPSQHRAASPHVPSPASSQIFERNVQEATLPPQTSPAIPSHIQTENHIPPVLEASSLALTDDHLSPDNVEIVMHSAHQPAAVTVTGSGNSEAVGNQWADESVAHPDQDDAASNYGALDVNDVRRLSFISFADVMQAEQVDHAVDSLHQPGQASLSSLPRALNRSPSPIRSPVSSHGLGTTPPTSVPASLLGLDGSPGRPTRGPGSPTSAGSPPPVGGELTIETMRQALRKTGSGDLSGVMSQPLSAASVEDVGSDHQWK